jgi:hypothetical protein
MSQNKFASHVLEVAFRNADGLVLDAMFSEILEGYHKHDKFVIIIIPYFLYRYNNKQQHPACKISHSNAL